MKCFPCGQVTQSHVKTLFLLDVALCESACLKWIYRWITTSCESSSDITVVWLPLTMCNQLEFQTNEHITLFCLFQVWGLFFFFINDAFTTKYAHCYPKIFLIRMKFTAKKNTSVFRIHRLKFKNKKIDNEIRLLNIGPFNLELRRCFYFSFPLIWN